MKSVLLCCLSLILCYTWGFPQENPLQPVHAGILQDTVHSFILNENRTVWVYLPASYRASPAARYPVAYLLDGDAQFNTVMHILQQLGEENMNLVLPQMILVGIFNTDRMRDLTPTHVTSDPDIPDPEYVKTTGGSEPFTTFLEKELFPHIDSTYRTAPYRILIGHSDAGLFCIQTLLRHTRLFNGYLAIDPNLSWDLNMTIGLARETLTSNEYKGTSLYLSIANQGYSDTDAHKDNAASFEFAGMLDTFKSHSLRYKWQYYKEDNHNSIPLISAYDGLRFLFDFYNPKIPYVRFRDPAYPADSFLVAHYNNVSRRMGYPVHPPETVVNWLGYLFVMEAQYEKAYRMMKLNTENYPDSWNAFDSLGEILMILGKYDAAIENYQKSLKLNPGNANATKMIEEMKRKTAP